MTTETLNDLAWLPYDFAQIDAALEVLRDKLRRAGPHSPACAHAAKRCGLVRRRMQAVLSAIEGEVSDAVEARVGGAT